MIRSGRPTIINKALFDPLVLRPIDLATPEQIFAQGRKCSNESASPARAAMQNLSSRTQPALRRAFVDVSQRRPSGHPQAGEEPHRGRTKIYDDYYPILRIDPPKLKEVMKPEEVKHDEYLKQIDALKTRTAACVLDGGRGCQARIRDELRPGHGRSRSPKKSQPVARLSICGGDRFSSWAARGLR
jgi:hypothetical protein